MLATFFLPMGYDVLFKALLDYTGSYLMTDTIFYAISLIFMIIHFIITKTNPLKEIEKRWLKVKFKLFDHSL